jgi:polysaccharide biosynthesis protein VpsM
MRRSRAGHTSKKNTSQATSDSGNATSSPRAKLPFSLATGSSGPDAAGNSLMSMVSSQRISGFILSNSARRKDRPTPGALRRQADAQFKRRLLRSLSGFSMVARLSLEALAPAKLVRTQAIRIKPLTGQVRATPQTLLPVLALACLLLPRPALAQEADKVVTPVDLFKPERSEGIRISPSVLAFPSLEVDATYDDNIYNTNAAALDDLAASIRPRLVVRTDWARHQISLSGGADIRRYADIQGENSEQFDIQGKGTLELAERTDVIADVGFRRGIEQRGTAGDQFLTDEPVALNRKFAGLLVRREGGFLELLAEGRIAATDYRDTRVGGFQVDLSDRDTTVLRGRIRASAPSSHFSRVFVQASINNVSYDRATPISRDSDGYGLLAGLILRLTDLVNLEAGAGYIHQSFDNPAIKNVKAVNFHLQVEWTPRPDWEIVAAANRVVEPSPRLDVPAILRSDFSLEARKAVSDRALITAEVGFIDEKYQSNGRKDQRVYAAIGAHYRLTDNVGLIARASWRKQDGNAFGRDYDGLAATLGARLRF